jgi:hypothetical protein
MAIAALGLSSIVSASSMASANDLDAIAANLQSHGFSCEQSVRELRACHNLGTLADGRPFAVNVFANEERAEGTGITIMIEPAEAARSGEAGGIYDYLAQTCDTIRGR